MVAVALRLRLRAFICRQCIVLHAKLHRFARCYRRPPLYSEEHYKFVMVASIVLSGKMRDGMLPMVNRTVLIVAHLSISVLQVSSS